MDKYIYAEFVEGGIQNRNKIYKVTDFKLNGIITDCYRSMFLYDEGLKYFVDKTGSVKGYSGRHISDSLVFDFDNEADLTAVKDEAVKFCNYLHYNFDLPFDYLRISFSGNKGFHICIPIQSVCRPEPKDNFYEIIKNIAVEISAGFKYVDHSIYESKRLLRIVNTKHGKSGLYKIPLLFDELDSLTIDEIKKFAQNKRNIETLPISEIVVNDPLNEIYKKWNDYQPIEHNENPPNEMLNLFSGVGESGRHKALIRITAMLEKKGLSYDLILEILRNWNSRNRPPLPDDRLENESLRCFDDNRKKQDISSVKIYSLQDAEMVYRDYIKKIDSCKVKTGYKTIDKKIRGILPGETLCILGKTSVGKSALLQNIGMNFAKESNEPVIFFSMEMPITSVYERACQIESGLTGYEIENEYKRNSNLIFTTLNNFYTIEKSGLNLEQIKTLILFAEENIYRKKTGLVLIDYLGLIKGNGKDIYEQVSRIARSTKDIAKELNVPIIFLSQVNRNYKEFDELEINAARDSGAIDEASDFILGIWKERDNRPEAEQKEIKLKLGILKNRKGGLGRTSITMEKRSLKITEEI